METSMNARLAALLQADDAKTSLLKELAQENERQSQKINNLQLQLEDETETKEKWRGRYLEVAKETGRSSQNAYVAILLDGDGMIFTEPYLVNGNHGGQTAATDLLQVTRNTLRISGLFGPTEPFEVVVRAFANVGGVADILRQRGLQADFRQFAVGFSQLRSLVDFIDVGRGKEMADAKIAGEIRFHLSNPSCKQVILGVSHDNGYVRILNSILADGEDHNRITLLEGVPFGKEYSVLPFSRVSWSGLFLSKKVEGWVPNGVQQQGRNKTKGGAYATPQTVNVRNLPPPPPYENIATEKKQEPTHPPPVPRPSAAILHRINIGPPPCWNHFLGQGCAAANNCGRTHHRTFTAGEMTALKFLAQGHRCQQGLKCKNQSCYYGHRCQEVGVCNGKDCPFLPEEHKPGKYKPNPVGKQANLKGPVAGKSGGGPGSSKGADKKDNTKGHKNNKGQKREGTFDPPMV